MIPLVSVIIPNYNHSVYLEKRLCSVFNQTYTNFEVIILDDYSTDYSKNILELYKDNQKVSKIIFNKSNSGSPFKQWQKGIIEAKGNYIWIAESDDFCDSNFLAVAVSELENSRSDLFYCSSIRVDENDNIIDEFEWWYNDLGSNRWKSSYVNNTNDEIKSFLIKKNIIVNASAVVFKNKVFIENYLENIINFNSCGDWLFWLQYLNTSLYLSYSTLTKNYFRSHSNTTRTDKVQIKRNNEILLIYKWICKNITKTKDNLPLLKYYANTHIIIYRRREIYKNIQLLIKSYSISLRTFVIFFSKYCKFIVL